MSYTLTFSTLPEAVAYFAAIRLRRVSGVVMSFVGNGFDDHGNRIAIIARKSGELSFDVTEAQI
jgi:hypothetical protein